ncbi:MAG: glycosyltransferase family 39 protein [Sedimentisphaerales bacterium]|nr:glycosyltransferase family 39 protein [Sedimentisphaerales bacterium]
MNITNSKDLSDIPQKPFTDKLPGWKTFLFGVIPPLLMAAFLYSFILTDDLFGDEFLQYRWSVLSESPYGSLLALDINAQLARIGYLLIGQQWALRLHSIIFSLGTIILVWMVAKHCFGSRTASVAAWIAAFSPYMLEFAAEARPNAIFIFAGILFLYALLLFIDDDGWPNTLLLIFSACFGLLARPMFIAILMFGFGYYIVKQRKFSLKLSLVSVLVVPFLILLGYQMVVFSSFGPKEPSNASASILNFLFRIQMAFNYGYSTLNYPERDAGWNISISQVLSEHPIYVLICIFLFCAIIIALFQLYRKARSKIVFLACAIVIPIIIMITVQETGFSLLNEKHCAGVVGAWYVLLAAIIVHISRYTWGKCAIVLYVYLICVSLFHFYFQPEIYSRRSNFTALNSFLTEVLKDDDFLISYHLSSERKPNYLPILHKAAYYIDLYQHNPTDVSLHEYVASFCDSYSGKIYLIYDSRLRPGIDPDNQVLSFLMKRYDFTLKHYGRNLKLYEFSSEKAD